MAGEHYQLPSTEVRPQPAPPQPGTAVVLEILPGLFGQTFGIGNIYAGNVAGGVLMMLGYWVSCVINFFLCFAIIGLVTWPLTWAAFMVFCPICANNTANARLAGAR